MTCIYVRYNNLKRTGQLRNVWVEFGFGAVCSGHSSLTRWSMWSEKAAPMYSELTVLSCVGPVQCTLYEPCTSHLAVVEVGVGCRLGVEEAVGVPPLEDCAGLFVVR